MAQQPREPDLFSEMKLYYEEIRDINSRTIQYIKIIGAVILGLMSYIFFGLQFAINAEELRKIPTPAMSQLSMISYGIFGITIAFLLFILLYNTIATYGQA